MAFWTVSRGTKIQSIFSIHITNIKDHTEIYPWHLGSRHFWQIVQRQKWCKRHSLVGTALFMSSCQKSIMSKRQCIPIFSSLQKVIFLKLPNLLDYKNQLLHNNIAAVQHSCFVSSIFLPKGVKIYLQLSPYSPQLAACLLLYVFPRLKSLSEGSR